MARTDMQSLVSILIPVHNARLTIAAAIDSCLAQTYPHIEILLLDNASSDGSLDIMAAYDSLKISILKNENAGTIAESRNKLLHHARGEYIAWLDADDTMHPDRIDIQVGFMTSNPGTDVAGSWIRTDDPDLPFRKLPLLHSQIKTLLWFKNCMIQPSVISKNFYRRENIWYDESYGNSVEDYELWYRLVSRKKFANIPQFLTSYHMTTGEALKRKKESNDFHKNLSRLWNKKWEDAHIQVEAADRRIFQDFLYTNATLSPAESQSLHRTLALLKRSDSDPFFRLVVSFHQLRLWKNMPLLQKIRHAGLLANLAYYFKIKRNYLF